MKLFTLLACIIISGSLSAQVVPAITGSNVTREEAKQALDFHNKVRKDVGAPPLEWSAPLSAYAQEWANHLAKNCKIAHRPIGGKWARKFGENIYWGIGKDFTALDASEAWYSEIKLYTYAAIDMNNWEPTGHYTQMIWSSTTKVGIGVARCSDGGIIIVANYDPPGNYMGQKPY